MVTSFGVRTLAIVIGVAALLAISGCAATPVRQQATGFHVVAVGETCLSDVRQAASLAATDTGQNPAPGDAEIKMAANDCKSVDEFESAVSQYPAALGLASPDAMNAAMDVGSVCGPMSTDAALHAAVCIDAVKIGLDKQSGYDRETGSARSRGTPAFALTVIVPVAKRARCDGDHNRDNSWQQQDAQNESGASSPTGR